MEEIANEARNKKASESFEKFLAEISFALTYGGEKV